MIRPWLGAGLAVFALTLATGCKKESVAGTYGGAFNGTRTGPSARGGIDIAPQAAAADVTIADASNDVTLSFETRIRTISGPGTALKCSLKATRGADANKEGPVEYQIAEQACSDDSGGAPPRLEGKLTGARGQSGFESITMLLETPIHEGAEPPSYALTLTFKGERKKP